MAHVALTASGLCWTITGLSLGASASAQPLANPGFESGLSGWTVRNTPNGVGAPGAVANIDIDGPGPLSPSSAAGFSVGQVEHTGGDEQGIELVQSVVLAAGLEYQIDTDWSAENTSNAGNSAAGLFCIILDGATIQCQSAGPISAHAWLYGHLGARFTVPATGMHELSIRITRPWRIADATLTDSVDNVALAAVCYANCDRSTEPPILNVIDFACFLNAFAAGDPNANCDGSSTPPLLNINDFQCFLNRFAAGCP